jgi:hypothetical protein
MISSAVIPTTASPAAALHPPEPVPSVVSQGLPVEDLCTKTRFHPRSCSTGSSVEGWALGFSLVGLDSNPQNPLRMLTGTGGGPQFVFNMGGGPGFTVHRMGGNRPRARPRDGSETAPSGLSALTQLLPLLLLFILPLLSSFFTGSTDSGPHVRYDSPVPPHTMHRVTPRYKVDYFLNPAEVEGYTSRQFSSLDQRAEVDYVSTLKYQCETEVQRQRHEINEATGFFFTDENRLQRARNMAMPGCRRLDELKVGRQY